MTQFIVTINETGGDLHVECKTSQPPSATPNELMVVKSLTMLLAAAIKIVKEQCPNMVEKGD
jgi:hypothetical protein